jgi:zinc D-Ala-D-Ala carboxypeptidase
MINWDHYPNFSKKEFDCQETGENEMTNKALCFFQAVRDLYGKPLIVTSGYRSPRHSIEKRKANPGAHAQGTAVDFRVTSETQGDEIEAIANIVALEMGLDIGVGRTQSFIHLDVGHKYAPRPARWTY